jgi:hypothetical protein
MHVFVVVEETLERRREQQQMAGFANGVVWKT